MQLVVRSGAGQQSIGRCTCNLYAAGTGGGFGGSADAKGPTAGFDPVMKPRKRYIYQRGLRKNWKKKDG